jgi:hypothetical protein
LTFRGFPLTRVIQDRNRGADLDSAGTGGRILCVSIRTARGDGDEGQRNEGHRSMMLLEEMTASELTQRELAFRFGCDQGHLKTRTRLQPLTVLELIEIARALGLMLRRPVRRVDKKG